MRQQHGRAYVRSRLLLHLRKYLVAQLAEVSTRRDAHYGGLRADVLPDGERVDEAVNVRSTRVDVVADDFCWRRAFCYPCSRWITWVLASRGLWLGRWSSLLRFFFFRLWLRL